MHNSHRPDNEPEGIWEAVEVVKYLFVNNIMFTAYDVTKIVRLFVPDFSHDTSKLVLEHLFTKKSELNPNSPREHLVRKMVKNISGTTKKAYVYLSNNQWIGSVPSYKIDPITHGDELTYQQHFDKIALSPKN